MNTNSKTKLWAWLFEPFVYIAGAEALVSGWVAIFLAALLASFSQTHFDGVLDVRPSITPVPLRAFVLEGFIDWFCIAAALILAGKIVARTSFRIIDIAGTQALARWPTIIISLLALPRGYQRFQAHLTDQLLKQNLEMNLVSSDAFVFFGVICGIIALICLMVFLMYKAYSISCNLTGPKALVSFIVAIIAAEICSKAFLYWVLPVI